MFTRYRRSLLLSMIITCVVSKPKQIKNATATGNPSFLGIPWAGNRLRVRKCSFSGLEVRPETKLFFSQVF